MKLLIINGPNLNFLGIREPNIYGSKSYKDLVEYLNSYSIEKNIELEVYQSNSEGAIIDKIQDSFMTNSNAIIINPGALTHYSYAIKDCISSINIPVVEVHLTNIEKREDFRKFSVIKDVCINTFCGKHFESYKEAIDYIMEKYAKT